MATSTSRLALTKPAGSENIDISILNANADKIDSVAGFTVVTSTTRPAAPFSGQSIRETDTGKTFVHNGSAPASAGWVQIPNVSTDIDLGAAVDIIWGGDTNLYRNAANVLRTDDALIVSGALSASAGITVTGNASVSGSAAITGAATVGGALAVTGAITENGQPVQRKNRLYSANISIVPSAANTPTSAALAYSALDGTVFRAIATASTTVPGSVVTGVAVTAVTSTGCTVWVTRTNTTSTVINVLVIGSDT